MCACNLFNVRQAWIESHAGRPLKKSAIKQFEVVLKEFCDSRKARWTSCASLNVFIYSATRKKCLISRFTDKRKEVLILSVMHIFTKNHTIENIAVVRILNHFTFTLPWIHVARTGYLSSWRKCIFFGFRPNLTYSYIDVKIVTSSPISHIS